MHILITGAAGMIGGKLAAALAARGRLQGREITEVTLVDLAAPVLPEGLRGTARALDIADPAAGADLVASRPDVIFHLAAVVSGAAEADLPLGYAVNLHGTLGLAEAIAAQAGYCPRFVFTSSIAVFGAPLPEVIGDAEPCLPLTSYGTQKAMCEMLINDLSRRGRMDGISLRLPTICIRPGRPNAAASGFYSSILREPLAGESAVLPVPDTTRHWFASPRAAVGFLLQAAEMDLAPLGKDRAVTLPGVDATVADEIAALERVAGPAAVARIRREPDATVAQIVSGWPQAFDPVRARALGFEAEPDMEAIIRAHVEDELGGVVR